MKKQGIAFLLFFCWIVGITAVFSFPPKLNQASQKAPITTSVSEIQSQNIHFRASQDRPQIPPFEIDWRLSAKLNSTWIPEFKAVRSIYLPPSFFQKSKALFDVKETFIRFFHSW
ncbi:hypothetical protein [Algoriphagus boseongensis]|uniref:hypothetical protein n=1 Tax=Algoriphagus boseongensis TaxID=1442587 RepID=UPI00105D89BD|nr:hypothetical protein [Algoriphagus boseongensis]